MKKCIRAAILPLFLGMAIIAGCGELPQEKYVESGLELLTQRNYMDAQTKFLAAIKKDQDVGEAYRGLGLCYYEQGMYEDALNAFGYALSKGAKETGTVYNLLAHCSDNLGRTEKAAYYFGEGLKFDDLSDALRKEMAFNEILAFEKLGDYKTATAKLEAYVESYPDDGDARKEMEFLHTQLR